MTTTKQWASKSTIAEVSCQTTEADIASQADQRVVIPTQPLGLWLFRSAFLVALLVTVTFPEWEQFAGKGMAFRAPFYALPMGIVPIVWKLRGSHGSYPWLVDLLVVAPFFADTLGNVFNFYSNYVRTDDVLHFGNWVLLMGGVTVGFGRTRLSKPVAWTLSWGLGALAIIWWEAAEFMVQKMGTAGLDLTYEDTIGDLLLSSTGGAVGAFLAVTFAWPSSDREEIEQPT